MLGSAGSQSPFLTHAQDAQPAVAKAETRPGSQGRPVDGRPYWDLAEWDAEHGPSGFGRQHLPPKPRPLAPIPNAAPIAAPIAIPAETPFLAKRLPYFHLLH